MKKPFLTETQLKAITEEYPTPFHLYDEKGIRENARKLNRAFSWNRGIQGVLCRKGHSQSGDNEDLKEEGCGMDCSS